MTEKEKIKAGLKALKEEEGTPFIPVTEDNVGEFKKLIQLNISKNC